MICLGFASFVGGTSLLFTELGQDFFPTVDAGQIRMHIRAPSGTRLEETEKLFTRVEAVVRKIIPPHEVATILSNIGLPANGINLAFGDSATVGSADGEMLIALREHHGSTPEYLAKLRKVLSHDFPEATFFFQPADIVGQILNFGLAAPIDIQISGIRRDRELQGRSARSRKRSPRSQGRWTSTCTRSSTPPSSRSTSTGPGPIRSA